MQLEHLEDNLHWEALPFNRAAYVWMDSSGSCFMLWRSILAIMRFSSQTAKVFIAFNNYVLFFVYILSPRDLARFILRSSSRHSNSWTTLEVSLIFYNYPIVKQSMTIVHWINKSEVIVGLLILSAADLMLPWLWIELCVVSSAATITSLQSGVS